MFIISIISPDYVLGFSFEDTLRPRQTRDTNALEILARFSEENVSLMNDEVAVVTVRRDPRYELELLERLRPQIENSSLVYNDLRGMVRRGVPVSYILNKELSPEILREARDRIFVGDSECTLAVRNAISDIGPKNVSVLITGETGTGKELVARALHEVSDRRDGPFIAISATELPKELIESVLFGHVKGAFTGADAEKKGLLSTANGGTFFLDEISALEPQLQAKFLRVIENGIFHPVGAESDVRSDVRCVVATNIDPHTMLEEGRLRLDLYNRLQYKIDLLSLAHRSEDIWPLVQFFIIKYNDYWNKEIPVEKVTKEALTYLWQSQWKGNVRELENVISRAVLFAEGDTLEFSAPEGLESAALNGYIDLLGGRVSYGPTSCVLHLSRLHIRVPLSFLVNTEGFSKWPDFSSARWQNCARKMVHEILLRTNGNISQAVRKFGVPKPNIYDLIKEFGIDLEDYRQQDRTPIAADKDGVTVCISEGKSKFTGTKVRFAKLLLQAAVIHHMAETGNFSITHATEEAAPIKYNYGRNVLREKDISSDDIMQAAKLLHRIKLDIWGSASAGGQILKRPFAGKDSSQLSVADFVSTVGPKDATVLITGRSGTGKSFIARQIHENSANRKKEPVVLPCYELNSGVARSELFGHQRGSFTGATSTSAGYLKRAANNTLIIENVDDLELQLQAALLRVLQEMEFAPIGNGGPVKLKSRIIFTASRNLQELEKLVEEGRFRRDLFYRISPFTLDMQPLKERSEEIVRLAEMFMRQHNDEYNTQINKITDSARKMLLEHDWTGNIWQLRNIIFAACVKAEKEGVDEINIDLLASRFTEQASRAIFGKINQTTGIIMKAGFATKVFPVLPELAAHFGQKVTIAVVGSSQLKERIAKVNAALPNDVSVILCATIDEAAKELSERGIGFIRLLARKAIKDLPLVRETLLITEKTLQLIDELKSRKETETGA